MNQFYQWLVHLSAYVLMPTMYGAFFGGIIIKVLIYMTTRREEWFAKEFEKRVHRFIDSEAGRKEHSFFLTVKRLLERTYYESFEVRAIMKRRKPDAVLSFTDRVFMVQTGCAQLVRDTLRQVQNMKHTGGNSPKFLDTSKAVFEGNPWFKNVVGLFPAAVFNEILGVMPGLFIIGGIFGTFLGIMQNLPELSGMDLADVQGSKKIMDAFLLAMSYAMVKSIIGIILSVSMTIMNGVLNVENTYVATVNKFENCLQLLWNASTHNKLPGEVPSFDEHKDPIDALAEQTVERELSRFRSQEKQAS